MKSQRFYCRVKTHDGRRLWGFRSAKESDLALACFMQDEKVEEADVASSFADTVDRLRVDRLLEYIPESFDPWGCKRRFKLTMVNDVDAASLKDYDADEPHDSFMSAITNPKWHAARILWLIRSGKDLNDPISIDNKTSHGHVHPQPIILDGWHRFFAHRFLGKKRIPVLYGGRVDLKNYLAGKRQKPPEE